MKVLAWILTAAALLIGADVFVKTPSFMDSTPYATGTEATTTTTTEEPAIWGSMEGGNGIPRPPD